MQRVSIILETKQTTLICDLVVVLVHTHKQTDESCRTKLLLLLLLFTPIEF